MNLKNPAQTQNTPINVIIFGSNGMLGRYVKEVFDRENQINSDVKFHIFKSTRNEYDIAEKDYTGLRQYIDDLLSNFNKESKTCKRCKTYIVNCAGAIPQKCNINSDTRTFIKLNTLFPLDLQRYCDERENVDLIHITTDCVYSGKDGKYNEDSVHDETSIYGVSKSLGEPKGAYVLRTSIIGEELYSKKSLLEWVIASSKRPINGYKNHNWNGVTCLTLARIILDLTINLNNGKELLSRGVTNIHSPDVVSKYELCVYINEIYDLGCPAIIPFETKEDVNKTLASKYKYNFNINSIKAQIQELWNYHHLKQ